MHQDRCLDFRDILSRGRTAIDGAAAAASFICMPVCSKILFMSFGISFSTGATGVQPEKSPSVPKSTFIVTPLFSAAVRS
jgi:hypothetical protein